MKSSLSFLLLGACAAIAAAQAPSKPAAPAATAPKAGTASSATIAKLPKNIPVVRGIVKTAFSLRYEDYKLGTGAEAEPGKMYKVHYTGYLASDGTKFDSSYDHPRQPVLDKDGKPVLDSDGKPKQGDPQPLSFPQGFGRLIPGWDQGFYGMKVGGKRRLFIPWQLAYGAKGRPGPDAAHPGIPPKADLIFDVELMDVSDFTPPMRPGMMPGRPMPPGAMRPGMPGAPPAPGAAPRATPAPGTPPAAGTAPAPTSPQAPAATPTPGSTPAPTPGTPPAGPPVTPPAQPQTQPPAATPPAAQPQSTPQ